MAVKYNKDTDYQALINDAVSKGDYASAAQYEQQRNAKIAGLNAAGTNKYGAAQTTKYAQHLDDGYQAHGSYFDRDMSAADKSTIQTLQEAYNTYSSLGDKQGMDNAHAAAESIRERYGYSGGADGSDYIKAGQRATAPGFSYAAAPTYTDKYQSQIDDLLSQILNREDFSYDVNSDPLYAQYAQQYQQQGQRSMKDTLGQMAARTGGLASSYAASAAQQASDYYMSQLASKVPELYQLAYSMYLDDKESQVEDLGLLQSMSDTQYGRYRDTMSDWRNDRDFAYGQYRDEVGDSQWQQNFDYTAGQNDIALQQWLTNFGYGVSQDELANSRYDSETAYSQALQKAETLAQYGDFSGYREMGYSEAQIAAMEQGYQQGQSQTGGGAEPTLTWSQTLAAIESGNTAPNVLAAYEYYMGVPFGTDEEVQYGGGYNTVGETTATGAYQPSEWAMVLNNIKTNLREGNNNAVSAYMDQIADGLSEEQWNEIEKLLAQYNF